MTTTMKEQTQEERFNTFYEEHRVRLHKRILCHVRDVQKAEEVEQITWIKVALYLPNVERKGRTVNYGWLWKIALRTAYDEWRKEAVRAKHTAFSLDTAPIDVIQESYQAGDTALPFGTSEREEENDPLAILVRRETMQRIGTLITHLPSTLQKQAVVSIMTGETPRELAERLDVPKGSVYSARRWGLEHIRRRIA